MDFTTTTLTRLLPGIYVGPEFDNLCKAVAAENLKGATSLRTGKRRNGDRLVKFDNHRAIFRFRTQGREGVLEVLTSDVKSGEMIEAPQWATNLADAVANRCRPETRASGTPVASNQNQQ